MTTPAPKAHAAAPFQGRPFALEPAPPLPSGMPSMMKPAELDLIYSTAKNFYTGHGYIIDAGIFMGASTIMFDAGLRHNDGSLKEFYNKKTNNKPIQSYERAIVTKPMRNFPAIYNNNLKEGESYANTLKSFLQNTENFVNLNVGDIAKNPVLADKCEIVFIDVAKNIDVLNYCNTTFVSRMIPNKSILIHQDFCWHKGWWINAFMAKYNNYFDLFDTAETSYVFRIKKELADKDIDTNFFLQAESRDILEMLDDSPFKSTDMCQYVGIELSTVHFMLQRMDAETALSRLEKIDVLIKNMLEKQRENVRVRRVMAGFEEIKRHVMTEKNKQKNKNNL